MYGIRWLASCNCGVRHELVDLLEVGRVEGTQGEEMDSI
jgi:hypothetical protein